MQAAPLYVPTMPRTGKEMSVRMTNCGTLGWVTDKERGYRYQAVHPVTGAPWPPIPQRCWSCGRRSRATRIRRRRAWSISIPNARMGLHQDRDEPDLAAPVVSVSLGDDCLFRVGQTRATGRPCRSG